jgi:signal transduction histidine kinase/CheY-like chemotaxis protein
MTDGWITAPLPANEAKRLEALYRYNILDTLPEAAFDRITRIASYLLEVPIAVVSLIDQNRQWFKSRQGLDAQETSRDLAFCAHTILHNRPLVVPDATKDPRFLRNPLVRGVPNIRFYAGAPLTTPDGFNIGTLCAIDTEIHMQLDEQKLEMLSDLATMVVDELELRVVLQKEKMSNYAKSSFLANMSHEIRTPMNGIIGMAGLILESGLTSKQETYAKIMAESAESLLVIINDILDFSKIEAEKMQLEHTPFNMFTLCENLAASFSSQCNPKMISFILHYDQEAARYVLGDPGRIRQIIFNLLSNAVKFTEKGSIVFSVTQLKGEDQGKSILQITVTDTGIGIAKEMQGMLFKKFAQVDASTTRRYGGTGLGLAICKELAQLMDGDVTVQSAVGEGASFILTLPLEKNIMASAYNADGKNGQKEIAADSTQRHVLVVEDRAANMAFAEGALQALGYKVSTAQNGLQAVDSYEKCHFDIILMDCEMPEMDGYEATRTIRTLESKNRRKPTLIIAITANAMQEDKQKCLNSGMNDYLSKPVRKGELQAMLARWSGAAPRTYTQTT